MCGKSKIAYNTISRFLEKKKTFTLDEIKEAIKKDGGIMRIAPGISISDFLSQLEDYGKLQYHRDTNKYSVNAVNADARKKAS